MDHHRYIARRRARFNRIGGQPVNIPYGTPVECKAGRLYLDGKQLCAATSKLSHEYFCQDDDGLGRNRGELVTAILAKLETPPGANEKQQEDIQNRWSKVWSDTLSQKYKRPEHEDFWLWNHDFFNAPVEDLQHIADLVGAKVKS